MIFVFIFGALGFGEGFQDAPAKRLHAARAFRGGTRALCGHRQCFWRWSTRWLRAGIEAVAHGYWSLFTAIYGPNQALALQFSGALVCNLGAGACAGYLAALVVVRLGTKRTLFLGIVLWCAGVLLFPVLYVELVTDEWRYSLGTSVENALLHCAGFTAEGVQLAWPIVSLAVPCGAWICGMLCAGAPAPLR